ncbi:MAG: anti-sigma factor antagonist [Chloroflexota bacterium]
MAFEATLEIVNQIAKITLTGELDATVAAQFRQKIEEAVAQQAKAIVLMVSGLDYMSSAGLRVLVFAKQKIGRGVDIFIVGAQEQITEPINQTGLQNSLNFLDTYDAAVIEK